MAASSHSAHGLTYRLKKQWQEKCKRSTFRTPGPVPKPDPPHTGGSSYSYHHLQTRQSWRIKPPEKMISHKEDISSGTIATEAGPHPITLQKMPSELSPATQSVSSASITMTARLPCFRHSRFFLTSLHLTDRYSPSLGTTYGRMFMVRLTLEQRGSLSAGP